MIQHRPENMVTTFTPTGVKSVGTRWTQALISAMTFAHATSTVTSTIVMVARLTLLWTVAPLTSIWCGHGLDTIARCARAPWDMRGLACRLREVLQTLPTNGLTTPSRMGMDGLSALDRVLATQRRVNASALTGTRVVHASAQCARTTAAAMVHASLNSSSLAMLMM